MAWVHADCDKALEYGEITQMGDKAALFKYANQPTFPLFYIKFPPFPPPPLLTSRI